MKSAFFGLVAFSPAGHEVDFGHLPRAAPQRQKEWNFVAFREE
jgi:hypothetical protein